ncbi:Transposase, partial [Dysosmobacter welbionis]
RRVRGHGRGPDLQGHSFEPEDPALHQCVLEYCVLRPADGERHHIRAQC